MIWRLVMILQIPDTNKGGSRRPEKSHKGWIFWVFPFLVFEKSFVVAAMAAWAEAGQGQG